MISNIIPYRVVPEYIYCKIVTIPGQTYDHKPYAIGYQKDSPYAEILDFHIDMMREKGTLDNIVSRYRGQQQQCVNPRFYRTFFFNFEQSVKNIKHIFSGKPLTWGNVFTAFGILAFGACISLCFFAIEKLSRKSKLGRVVMDSYNHRVDPPVGHENQWDTTTQTLAIKSVLRENP